MEASSTFYVLWIGMTDTLYATAQVLTYCLYGASQYQPLADGPPDDVGPVSAEILSSASRDSTATDGTCNVRVTINGLVPWPIVNCRPTPYVIRDRIDGLSTHRHTQTDRHTGP